MKVDAEMIKRAIEFSMPQISSALGELADAEPPAISIEWGNLEALCEDNKFWLIFSMEVSENVEDLI